MSGILISAAWRSSGKTTVATGLIAGLAGRGLAVQRFKKGPDYIDPLWLSQASGRSCYNLDFYTMARAEIEQTFREQLHGADLGLVEGNKGLYDGLDLDGSNSNAALAALLGAPVVLVLDTRGMTRGVAPLILGYQAFDPQIRIAGVILNHVGGPRHEGKLRRVIEHYTDVRVVGAVAHARELEKIADTIAYHRERNIGFQWWVTPFDTPADLRARLERQGMVLAGDAATMARLGLDNLDDIPCNPDVMIELLDGYDDAAIDAIGHITMVCFNWLQEQVDERRQGWVERMRDPRHREKEATYLARLNGQPAGYGRVQLRGGVAYLGGAATLPEYRGRHIYSILVRRRLEEARSRGFHLAVINAEPLSRPIAARCVFKEYGRTYIYAWMPVIDMDVIKSLVPQ